jgi:ADP-heptose:LPS heptosyltransferase
MFFIEYKSLFNLKLYRNLFRRRIVLKKKERAVGDTLLLSAMAREMKRVDPDVYIITETLLPELFYHNPNVDESRGWHIYSNKNNAKTWYNIQKDQQEHVIFDLLKGLPYSFSQVDIGVDLYLTQAEKSAARSVLGEKSAICIMSSGKTTFNNNREWGEANFQKVVDYFKKDFLIVQIGSLTEALLDGVRDYRGKTLRETAAIIHESLLFIGQEGGLMHLANGVKKRSVIIYGGYLHPSITGYGENINLHVNMECSPCYTERKNCIHHNCLKMIHPKDVIQAGKELLNR